MKTLSPQGIKILKIIHLLLAGIWIGGAVALTLLLFALSPDDAHGMYIKSRALQLIDDWMIIPGAVGCFLTGLVYAIWTKWGFFKHHWITVKWVLTVAMIAFGTVALGPWINGNVYPVAEIARYADAGNAEYAHNLLQSKIWGSLQTSLFLFIFAISVLKPWKKKST